jgi:Protein of unknown function (DUF2442)
MNVISAKYNSDYIIDVKFSNRKTKSVDFQSFLFANYNTLFEKYKDIEVFKSFKIEDGKLVWGDNWELIFPTADLYNQNLH